MPWVELSQAALELGVSERTIRNWIRSGKLEARTENGRREVEIPELQPEAVESERIDDANALTTLPPQKRLEVALLECGRIKGTLVSQERIMEGLSANITELNAKLQHTQGLVAKRTMFSLAAVFLGILAYLLSSAFNQDARQREVGSIRQQADRQKDLYITDIKSIGQEKDKTITDMQQRYLQQIQTLTNEHRQQLLQVTNDRDQAVAKLRQSLTQEADRRITELTTQLEAAQNNLRKTQEENKALNERLQTGLSQFKAMQEAYRKTIQQLELAKARINELEKARQELSATVDDLQRKLADSSNLSKLPPPPGQ